MLCGSKQWVIWNHAWPVFDGGEPQMDFLKHDLGVSLSPLKMLVLCPSIFSYLVLMLKVIEQSEELCYLLCLYITFNIKELALDMLQARQPLYSCHIPDSNMTVTGIVVTLECTIEAFNLLFKDLSRAQ